MNTYNLIMFSNNEEYLLPLEFKTINAAVKRAEKEKRKYIQSSKNCPLYEGKEIKQDYWDKKVRWKIIQVVKQSNNPWHVWDNGRDEVKG